LKDLNIILYKALVPVKQIEIASFNPTSVVIMLKYPASIKAVHINGVPCTDIQEKPHNTLLVRLPVILEGRPIERVAVFAGGDKLTAATADIELGVSLQTVSGSDKLVQQCVKVLKSKIASSIFRKKEGTRFDEAVGEPYDPEDPSVFHAQVINSVNQLRSSILDSQIGRILPPDERLVDIRIEGFNFDQQMANASLSLKLIDGRGENTVFNMNVGL